MVGDQDDRSDPSSLSRSKSGQVRSGQVRLGLRIGTEGDELRVCMRQSSTRRTGVAAEWWSTRSKQALDREIGPVDGFFFPSSFFFLSFFFSFFLFALPPSFVWALASRRTTTRLDRVGGMAADLCYVASDLHQEQVNHSNGSLNTGGPAAWASKAVKAG